MELFFIFVPTSGTPISFLILSTTVFSLAFNTLSGCNNSTNSSTEYPLLLIIFLILSLVFSSALLNPSGGTFRPLFKFNPSKTALAFSQTQVHSLQVFIALWYTEYSLGEKHYFLFSLQSFRIIKYFNINSQASFSFSKMSIIFIPPLSND